MADSYAYRVRNKDGRFLEGKMEADGEGAVAARLRKQGMIPVEITKEAKVHLKTELHILPEKVKLKDLAIFSRQFATMINSGLSLLRALNILAEQTENPLLAKTTGMLRDDVERGSSLSAAMTKHPKVFSTLFVSMVRAGETGGQLDTILTRVADSMRGRLQAPPEGEVGDDLSGDRCRYRVPAGYDHAAVRRADVRQHVQGSRRRACRLPTKILVSMSENAKIIVPLFIVGMIVSVDHLQEDAAEERRVPVEGGQDKAPHPDLRAPLQEGRPVPLLANSGFAPASRRPGAPGSRHRRRATGNEVLARASQDVKESVKSGESMSASARGTRHFSADGRSDDQRR